MANPKIGRPRTIDPDSVSLIALRLFDDRGFDAISMDDVAEAAGVSRRSLFRLFPTKASLVWGGLDEYLDRFSAALADQASAASADERARTALREAAAFPAEVVEVTRHRLRVIEANPGLSIAGDPRWSQPLDVLTSVLMSGSEDLDSLTATVRAHAYIAASMAALFWWARHGEGRPEDIIVLALEALP